MADMNIIIVGDRGAGKSTASRVVSKALREAGFVVELTDKDDMNQDRFDKCLKALQGKTVRVSCGNVHLREKPMPKISATERSLGRSEGYHDLSPREQWDEDKRNGILDWDGTEEDAAKIVRDRGGA